MPSYYAPLFKPPEDFASHEFRYKAVRLLGSGANGDTLLVSIKDGPKQGHLYALKCLRDPDDVARKHRFDKEMQFLADPLHPNIPRVIDSGHKIRDGKPHPFFAMPYFPNTLRQFVGSGLCDFAHSLTIGIQLLSALNYTGSSGIVHRDIKPENIFMSGRQMFLGDFGVLKDLKLPEVAEFDDEADFYTQTELEPGPRSYRTPEMLKRLKGDGNAKIGIESDIFQAGLVLYEMFNGHNPAPEIKVDGPVPDEYQLAPLHQLGGNLGGRVSMVISSMLSIEPQQRKKAPAALEELNAVLDDLITMRLTTTGEAL
jgi:serine/threonine protein kinase